MNNNIGNSDLNPKDGYKIIYKHKFVILIMSIIGAILAAINVYYKPNIYESTSSIQVTNSNKAPSSIDFLTSALMGSGTSGDIDTAKEVIKSRSIVLAAMSTIDLTKHVWGEGKYNKLIELYKDAPISPIVDKGKGLLFELNHIDSKSFDLVVKGTDNSGNKFDFEGSFNYNTTINNDYFKIKVIKTGKAFNFNKYKFKINQNIKTAQHISSSSLKTSRRTKQANIIDISYEDAIPSRSKDFVNELTKVYIKKVVEQKTKNANKALEFINEQLNRIEGNLKKSQTDIEKFKSKKSIIDIKLSAQDVSKKISEFDNKLGLLNMQISILKNTVNKIQRGEGLATLTIVGTGVDSQSINKLTSELQQAMLDRKALLQDYTPAHPVVKKLSDRIENLKGVIKESVTNTLSALEQQKAIMQEQRSKYAYDLKGLPKIEQNYLTLERRVSFNNKFYTYLLEKKTEMQIKKAAMENDYKILDLAVEPDNPIKPKKKIFVIVGAMAGAIFGLIFAFFLNSRDNTIKASEDIEEIVDVPIIAKIPKYKREDERDLIVKSRPKSAAAESFRLLRTNMQFLSEHSEKGTLVAVTSTVANEGKTTISANLAASLQALGKKVIILNFDLRKPTLHKIFDLPNGHGLSSYLSNQVGLEKILKHTKITNLDIIPSGAVPPNPSELISSVKVDELVDKLKKYYDYIILDTPPVGIVTDARTLLAKADLTIYIVRAGYTKKEFLKTLQELKNSGKTKSLNIVLNETKQEYDKAYGYGYYK